MSTEVTREQAASERIGTVLHGKWRLNSLIAVGGMAAVYDGTHRNGMRGAVKILDLELARVPECRKRFLREGRLANRVRHAGAVRVLDDDDADDGSTYLVMELLEGVTLEDLAVRKGGTLPAAEVIAYGLQVCDTLRAAHSCGIIHRDVKPENLFLTRDGVVKLLDFGIASVANNDDSVVVTRPGESFGTPAFMSPEQARGRWELVDQQSDVFALGASLFTLMTGSLVHADAETVAEMLALAITEDPPSLRHVMPDAPDALVNAIDGALKLDKTKRWANVEAMRHALDQAYAVLKGEPAPIVVECVSPPTTMAALVTTLRLPKRRRAMVGAALVVLASAGVFSILPRNEAVATMERPVVQPAAMGIVAAADSTPTVDPPEPPTPTAVVSARPRPKPVPSATVRRYEPLFDRRY